MMRCKGGCLRNCVLEVIGVLIDMDVMPLGGRHRFMSEQDTDGLDVHAVLDSPGRKK